MTYYFNNNRYPFKHEYNLKTLRNYSDWATRDINRLEEEIERIKQYQADLFHHAQEVLVTPKKYVVKLHRRAWKKVEFFVSLEHRPILSKEYIDGKQVCGESISSERFEGKQRKEALKLARDLRDKYCATVEITGFGKEFIL